MRWLKTFSLLLFFLGLNAEAAAGKILKVLPHYLDQQGRHTLSPSLYERDAYQAHLRKTPSERSALRFDIQWKAKFADANKLKLRVELRTSQGRANQAHVREQPARSNRWLSHWSSVTWGGEDFKQAGEIIAWRATLWEADQLLSEQKSFLW